MRFAAGLAVFLAITRFAAAEDLHSFGRIQLNDQFWSEEWRAQPKRQPAVGR